MKRNPVNVILALAMVLSLILPLSSPAQAGASPDPTGESPGLNYDYSIKFIEERPLEKGQESIIKTPLIFQEIPQAIEFSSVSWTIELLAAFLYTATVPYVEKLDDIIAYASTTATTGTTDIDDIPDPPNPPEAPFMDIEFMPGPLKQSAQPLFGTPLSATWTFRVKPTYDESGTLPVPVTLTWTLNNVPATYVLTITDTTAGITTNLRTTPSYLYTGTDSSFRNFTLIALFNEPPTVNFISPNGGEYISGTYNISASASDTDGSVSTVTFYYSTTGDAPWTLIGDHTALSGSLFSRSWNTEGLNSTTVKLRAVATDNKGGVGERVSAANFTIDNTPPTLNNVLPSGGRISGTYTISAGAQDTIGVTTVAFHYAATPYTTWSLITAAASRADGTAASGTWASTWNTSAVADGEYKIRATASDTIGWTASLSSAQSFIVDNTVGIPTNLTPSHDARTNNPNVNFIWIGVIDFAPVNYALQVATTPNFALNSFTMDHSFADLGTATSHLHPMALGDGLYYWMVKARDGMNNIGEWSTSTSFRVDTAGPPPPALFSPDDGATGQDLKPTFIWIAPSDPSGIASYRLKVADNLALSSPIVDEPRTATSYTLTSNLSTATSYYWSVNATDGAGNTGAFAATRGFVTMANPPPVITLVTSLAWTYQAGIIVATASIRDDDGISNGVSSVAFYYRLTASPSWTKIGADLLSPTTGTTVAGTWSTNWNTGTVADDSTYNLMVEAIDRLGSAGSVTTGPFTIDNNPPPAPALSSPADALRSRVTARTFMWGAVTDASGVKYDLQIATTANFAASTFFLDKTGLTAPSYSLGGAEVFPSGRPDTTYYWRVRAREAAGALRTGPYASPTFSYILDTTVSKPILLSPSDGLLLNTGRPTLTWSLVTDGHPATVTYMAIIDDDINMGSPATMSDVSSARSFQPITPLSDGKWYWSAEAFDGLSNMSGFATPSWSFTVDTIAPPAPTLISPASGAELMSDLATMGVTLGWSAVTDPSGVTYTLQVATTTAFTSPVVNQPGLTATTAFISPLKALITYYWRVRATDGAGNAGAWSSTFEFSITSVNAATTAYPGWNMFSLPFTPVDTSSFDYHLSDDLATPLYIFSYNNSTRRYDYLPPASIAVGYWLYVLSEKSIDVVGTPAAIATSYYLSIGEGWNLIGHPLLSNVLWGTVRVERPSLGDKSLVDAAVAGWLSEFIFWWNGTTRRYDTLNRNSNLEPMKGYWVKSNVSDARLIIPAP